MTGESIFGRGFVEVFVEGWPLLVTAGLLYAVFRRLVLQDRARHGPVRGPFRPIGGFLGAAVIAVFLQDSLGSWWLVTLAFVALLAIGTELRRNIACWFAWPPTLAAWGYCVWTEAAPGLTVSQKSALVAAWVAVLAWVLRSLMGVRLAQRIWRALGKAGKPLVGIALYIGWAVVLTLAFLDHVWWLLLLLIGLVGVALAVGLLGVWLGAPGHVPRFLTVAFLSGLAAVGALFCWAFWLLFEHHIWWPVVTCGAALVGVPLAILALQHSRRAPRDEKRDD